MVSILIFCHDKKEGDFFGCLCEKCVKIIEREYIYSFIMSDVDYDEADIYSVNPPAVIIAEIISIDDLERVKRIRARFNHAKLLLLTNNQISAESYIIPEIVPDLLLLKPYTHLKAINAVKKVFLHYYKDRYRGREKKQLLEIQTGGEVYYFNYTEIDYLEARNKKIVLHRNGYEISFYSSLRELEKNLPPYFIRCHRSYIVNFMFIQKVNLANSIFYLNEKTVIPISQKYKAKLMKIL